MLTTEITKSEICKNCGATIPANSEFCLSCGLPISSEKAAVDEESLDKHDDKATDKTSDKQSKSFIRSRKSIIIGGIIVTLCIGIFLFFSNRTASFTELEQTAINYCKNFKASLRNPDSFVLYSDIIVIGKYDKESDELEETFYLIDYGATNGYGAMDRGMALLSSEYGYLGDYNDVPEYKSSDNMDTILRKSHYALATIELIWPLDYNGVGKDNPPPNSPDIYFTKETVSKSKVEKQLK